MSSTQSILFLNASMTGTSKKFAEAVIEQIVTQKQEQEITIDEVLEVNLNEVMDGQLLTGNNLATFWNDAQGYVEMLKQADIIVCATSLINYNASPAMQAFLNKVTVSNLTFTYNETGQVALLAEEFKDKKVYVVATAGSTQQDLPSGPATAFEATCQSFEFIGLQAELVRFDGTNAPHNFGKSSEELIAAYSDTFAAISI